MTDIDICKVFKMMQEFKLLKNFVFRKYSKFLATKQKRYVLDLEPSKILTKEAEFQRRRYEKEDIQANLLKIV